MKSQQTKTKTATSESRRGTNRSGGGGSKGGGGKKGRPEGQGWKKGDIGLDVDKAASDFYIDVKPSKRKKELLERHKLKEH